MERRYSDYTVEELRDEIGRLKEKVQKAEQMGNISEYAIYERKIHMALAYTMNPGDFKPNEVYEIHGDPGQKFKINYLNGVFAWGNRINLTGDKLEDQEALPISLLNKKVRE
ncbi:YfhH family protein [Aquibacillus sp. 3ASR75-11]|uniref:YfhH family protein n=1 Tax=Terrihalobacillus insolitus TaxID=2950438 RepID=A0A9X3WSQ5_9BACI|nr:YfhH family protein [Terrihalobacillus insolitus]MDC3425277.1 YfhH family protein [Terrihalobacillus insolitus]